MTRLHYWPARASSAVNTLRADRQPVVSPLDYALDEEPEGEVGVRHRTTITERSS